MIEISLDSFNPKPWNPDPETLPGITLRPAAYEHIKKSLDARGKGLGIRFGVKSAGCGGYTYVVEYVDEQGDTDRVDEQDGIKIFVDHKSLILLSGLEVDYKTDMMQSGLEFINNQATHCGCGESFTPKK